MLLDLSLADIFGQVDLSWLPVIKSAPTVVRVDDEQPVSSASFMNNKEGNGSFE